MGHTPGGVNNQQGKSSGSGRGYIPSGRGYIPSGRGYHGFGRGRINSDNAAVGQRNQNNSSSRHVHFAHALPTAPPAASLPRFPDAPPSFDELDADPEAAQLLQQAMAALRRNRQQGEQGVITVSIFLL